MTIEVCYANPETGELSEPHPFASVPLFFHTLDVMSQLRPHLIEALENESSLAESVRMAEEWREEFVGEDLVGAAEAFGGYCNFTASFADDLKKNQKISKADEPQLAPFYSTPDDFDPDLIAMFGRAVFMEQPMDPDSQAGFAFYCRGFLGMMMAIGIQARKAGDKDTADAIGAADKCLRSLTEFLEESAEKQRWIGFSV